MVELIKQNLKENKKVYKKIEKDLRKNIPLYVPIEHVGSTAIPNMYGKNIIDILIGAKDDIEFDYIHRILIKNKFVSSKRSKTKIYEFFASTASETTSGDIHIHLVIVDTDRYKEFIILRDYLLSNKEEAKNYSNFKKNLIKSGITSREDYRSQKSKYVERLLLRAKKNI